MHVPSDEPQTMGSVLVRNCMRKSGLGLSQIHKGDLVLIIKLYLQTSRNQSTYYRIQKLSFISNLKKIPTNCKMQLTIPTLLTTLAVRLVVANPIPTPLGASTDVLLDDVYGGTCYHERIGTLACKKAGHYPACCCCSDLKGFLSLCGLLGPPYDYSKEVKDAMKKCNSKC